MALKSLLSGLRKGPPAGPVWQPEGPYPLLFTLDSARLADWGGKGGVAVVWHLGICPRWLCVAEGADLARLVLELLATPELQRHEAEGGVYVAWCGLAPEQRAGACRHLIETLQPLYLPPGYPGGATPVSLLPPPLRQAWHPIR